MKLPTRWWVKWRDPVFYVSLVAITLTSVAGAFLPESFLALYVELPFVAVLVLDRIIGQSREKECRAPL